MNPLFFSVAIFTFFFRVEVISHSNVQHHPLPIVGHTLPEDASPEHYPFGIVQSIPHSNKQCTKTCEEMGDFDSCEYPKGDFIVPGYMLSYNESYEKRLDEIRSGYPLIPYGKKKFCYCQKKGVRLQYTNAYEALKRETMQFYSYVNKTSDAARFILLNKTLSSEFEDQGHRLTERYYEKFLIPLLDWCEKVSSEFSYEPSPSMYDLPKELQRRLHKFHFSAREFILDERMTSKEVQPIKTLINSIRFEESKIILRVLGHRFLNNRYGMRNDDFYECQRLSNTAK